jgi:hypothetical protein
VPGAGNPQALNRYAFVLNNPLKYIDPTGHGYCDSPYALPEDCAEADKKVGTPPQPPKPPSPFDLIRDAVSDPNRIETVMVEVAGIPVYVMPPDVNQLVPRSQGLQKIGTAFGIAGFLFDVGEMIGIFVPEIGGEDAAAVGDLLVTSISCVASGQCYVGESPHPDLPPMIGVSQDILITAGDLGLASVAKAGGAAIGGPPGYVAGLGADVITTAISGLHDFSRVFGGVPNRLTVGVTLVETPVKGGGTILRPQTIIVIWP